MENAKVIEFPKAQSVRKRLQDKGQEQKAGLVLSIASVLVTAVFLNQWLVSSTKHETTMSSERQIASLDPATSARDIKWEHELAKKLSTEEFAQVVGLAEKPTSRDELVFGFLEGKYGMKMDQGHVQSLEFIDAQAGEQPLDISNKRKFLLNYPDAFGLSYNEVSLTENKADNQSFSLINADKKIVGYAHFALDDKGRVLSVKITQ
jgi:hypothetical protein